MVRSRQWCHAVYPTNTHGEWWERSSQGLFPFPWGINPDSTGQGKHWPALPPATEVRAGGAKPSAGRQLLNPCHSPRRRGSAFPICSYSQAWQVLFTGDARTFSLAWLDFSPLDGSHGWRQTGWRLTRAALKARWDPSVMTKGSLFSCLQVQGQFMFQPQKQKRDKCVVHKGAGSTPHLSAHESKKCGCSVCHRGLKSIK